MMTVELYVKSIEEVFGVGNKILVEGRFSVAIFDAMDLFDCCDFGNINLVRSYPHHGA